MGKEKRYFRRYRRKVSVDISHKGTTVEAVALDYSLTGIGALLQKGPYLPRSVNLQIRLHNEPVEALGRIAWRKETPEGVRFGIELVGPIRGSLETYMLSDLLIGLQRTRKNGTLEITSGSLLKKVFIKNGDIIYATSNLKEDMLGDVLFREGRITMEQYNRGLLHMKKKGIQKHGAALVDLGYLNPRDLFEALKVKVEKIIIDLFKLETGDFHFHQDQIPRDEVIKLNFSAANLIYKGLKKITDPDVIQGFFPSFKTVLRLSPDPLDLFQDITLDDDDRAILAHVDGKKTIDIILSQSPVSKLDALKILYTLFSANIITDAEEHSLEEFGDDVDLVAEVIEEAKGTVGEQTVAMPEEFIRTVDDLYNRLGKIGYYEILGLKEDASLNDIKRTYYKMAKNFHPDRHFHLDDDMKDKLSMIFSYITSAYSTISDPGRRQEYDKERRGGVSRHASGTDRAKDKFHEGMEMLTKGQYEDAAELFGQAAYMNRNESEYYYYYGMSLYKMGKLKEGEREIRNALKMDALNPDYLAEIGHIYLEMGFPLRARGTFEKALKTEPSHRRALEGMEKLPPEAR